MFLPLFACGLYAPPYSSLRSRHLHAHNQCQSYSNRVWDKDQSESLDRGPGLRPWPPARQAKVKRQDHHRDLRRG
jgi:hypothetical protein